MVGQAICAALTKLFTTPHIQDVAVREAEAVELQGDRVDEADTGSSGGLTPRQAGVLRWAADTYMQVGRVGGLSGQIILFCFLCVGRLVWPDLKLFSPHEPSPAPKKMQKAFSSVASVLIWHKGRTLLRKGIVAPAVASATGGKVEVLAIAQKALTPAPDPDGLSQPTYIPDLQVCCSVCCLLLMVTMLAQYLFNDSIDDRSVCMTRPDTTTGPSGARGVCRLPPRPVSGSGPPAVRRQPGPRHFGGGP